MNADGLTAEQRYTVKHAAEMGGFLVDTSDMTGGSPALDRALVEGGVFRREAEPGQVPRWVLTDLGRWLAEQL